MVEKLSGAHIRGAILGMFTKKIEPHLSGHGLARLPNPLNPKTSELGNLTSHGREVEGRWAD